MMGAKGKGKGHALLVTGGFEDNATASETDAPPCGPRNASGIKPCGLRRSEAKEEENMVNALASPATFPKEIKLVDAAI